MESAGELLACPEQFQRAIPQSSPVLLGKHEDPLILFNAGGGARCLSFDGYGFEGANFPAGPAKGTAFPDDCFILDQLQTAKRTARKTISATRALIF
jgi:hypothetical protein